jgi:cytoskeletal protein CcmA (bactofilin family)
MTEKGGSEAMSDGSKGASGAGKRTLIEEGTAISGNLASSCPIVVMGKIEGDISGPSMEVAESGVVSGKIKVKTFSSRGELAGELEAETVELAGRVRDETVIRAGALEVAAAAGASLQFGECELCIGDEPDKRAAIEEVTGARKSAVAANVSPVAPERRRRNTGAVATALEGKESGPVA